MKDLLEKLTILIDASATYKSYGMQRIFTEIKNTLAQLEILRHKTPNVGLIGEAMDKSVQLVQALLQQEPINTILATGSKHPLMSAALGNSEFQKRVGEAHHLALTLKRAFELRKQLNDTLDIDQANEAEETRKQQGNKDLLDKQNERIRQKQAALRAFFAEETNNFEAVQQAFRNKQFPTDIVAQSNKRVAELMQQQFGVKNIAEMQEPVKTKQDKSLGGSFFAAISDLFKSLAHPKDKHSSNNAVKTFVGAIVGLFAGIFGNLFKLFLGKGADTKINEFSQNVQKVVGSMWDEQDEDSKPTPSAPAKQASPLLPVQVLPQRGAPSRLDPRQAPLLADLDEENDGDFDPRQFSPRQLEAMQREFMLSEQGRALAGQAPRPAAPQAPRTWKQFGADMVCNVADGGAYAADGIARGLRWALGRPKHQ